MFLGDHQIFNITHLKWYLYVLFMIYVLTNSYGQKTSINSKPDYLYSVKQTRVFPDTSILKNEYFDKNNNIVYSEEFRGEGIHKLQKYIYKNDTLREIYGQYGQNGAVNKVIFKYFNDTVVSFGYYSIEIDYIRVETCFDKSPKIVNTDDLYAIVIEDTTINFINEYPDILNSANSKKHWSYKSKYDRFGRKIEWTEIKDSGISFSTFYKYRKKTDTIPSRTWTDYNSIITQQHFDSGINTIEIYYDSSNVQRKVEYYNSDSFKYKEDIYGLIYFHYVFGEGDPFIDKGITDNPDQILIYEKYYR